MTDGVAYLIARDRMWDANRAQRGAVRFRKRFATWAVKEPTAVHDNIERAIRDRWNEVPHTEADLITWGEAVARREAETDSRMIETRHQAEKAHQDRRELTNRHNREHADLSRRMLGGATPSIIAARVTRLRKQAAEDRRDLSQLETLPTAEAAQLVHDRTTLVEAQRLATEQPRRAAEARAAKLWESPIQQIARHYSGPSRDMGLSL
jgi:hypothetical protein